ncbi:MAG: hypothetical protein TH68_01870 [Candidatus Synechococcus spongiarum 142]|uniref:PIN domain-containing protein n=1 Tax=Candidatus Synechococcus spongiarum 142 TaxID=1608213 RepID=A0A6N3X9Q4_9SYNE|nr:MAG: hypothetical protein TH68_01870 [Candidatus Synechococcus spongiarum 142]
MPIPVRRLLAGSAVAGLLFLFPLGDANAQDNRNNGGWIEGGVVLSLIAAAVGAAGGSSLTVWWLSKNASKGKRDNGKMDAVLARFDQLDSGVSAVGTKLEKCINNGVNKLTSTVENKTSNFNDRFNQLDSNVKILSEKLIKLKDDEQSLSDLDNEKLTKLETTSEKETHRGPIIIDTSAIINGSIIGLLEADLPFEELKGHIIVHECIENELKGLRSDKNDINKVRQGGVGWENLYKLRTKWQDRIDFVCYNPGERQKPDEKLLQLTKDNNGIIVTRDRELVKNCCDQGLRTINLDDLSKVLRERENLIGREFDVDLKKQSEKNSMEHPQDAVAYIYDSLVVVKNASDYIGDRKRITITDISKAGTYFAKLINEAENPPQTSPTP